MRTGSGRFTRPLIAAVVGSLTIGFWFQPSVALADSAPPDVGVPETVTADLLPTVQHNGVAWDQVVVGHRVFVVGAFSKARPAGAALGIDEVPRANILAFDIRTGVLDPSFAPVLDGQALTIGVSPDQKTIYVGGEFQKVNGLWRVRLAAFDVATGALTPWAPVASTTVRTMDITNGAVYLGGDFNGVAPMPGQALTPRRFAAAVDPVSGAVLGWDPSPDAPVTALTVNRSGSKVVLAGRFVSLADRDRYGMGAVDPVSGAVLPWAATATVRDAGESSALTSLVSSADGVYGTGYVFGMGGNFEGVFRADNETGELVWLADCHGDHYSVFPIDGVVYTASHAHYCGNIGGFPQTVPWTSYHSGALTDDVRGMVTKNVYSDYANFEGIPAPAQLNWFPSWYTGTVTTSGQAAWSVSGNDQYVVYAGEFIGLNGAAQQGLVRFAKKGIAPNKQTPRPTDGLTPSLISTRSGQVRVGWQATHDRDNEAITYKVFRDFTSLSDTPVHEVTVNSLFWRRPDISFVDSTAVAGRTYEYVVYAFDPFGNRVHGDPRSITAAGKDTEDAFVNTLLADEPTHYFPLGEKLGSDRLLDMAGADHALAGTGVTLGSTGVHGRAASFDGTASASATQVSQLGPDTFSVEAWFQTTSSAGGHILGYGTNQIEDSTWADRKVYIDGSGRVSFGVNFAGAVKAVSSPAGFNDGVWHHVVGTVGPKGLQLYLDGQSVASRADATGGRYYSGVWRIGGDGNTNGWPNRPSNGYFTGSIDEVAIYGSVLTAARVADHSVPGDAANTEPMAAFTSSVDQLTVTVDASASSDDDGDVAAYEWTFGDGSVAQGVRPKAHTYATPGTYEVTLTVTDDRGGVDSLTKSVSVPAATAKPAKVSVAKAGFGNKLFVDVDPDKGSRHWNLVVQRREAGTWSDLAAYQTEGDKETRTIRLGPGTFRVVVKPKFGRAGVTSEAVKLTKKTVKAYVSRNASRSKLYVNVNPNKGGGYWRLQVQKKRARGSWKTRSTVYRTKGKAETRTIDLSRGRYRIIVKPKYGYLGTTSSAVTLRR